MSVRDWRTAVIAYDDITATRQLAGCEWCSQPFGRPHPATLVSTGEPDGVSVVHTHCVEPMQQRAHLTEVAAILAPLVAEFERAEEELTSHPDYEYSPPDKLYHARDDAAVEVAGHVAELLDLISTGGPIGVNRLDLARGVLTAMEANEYATVQDAAEDLALALESGDGLSG